MQKEKYICDECKNISYDIMASNKHKWLEHPSNEYEKIWSNLYKSGKLCTDKYTMGYQDDPYY